MMMTITITVMIGTAPGMGLLQSLATTPWPGAGETYLGYLLYALG